MRGELAFMRFWKIKRLTLIFEHEKDHRSLKIFRKFNEDTLRTFYCVNRFQYGAIKSMLKMLILNLHIRKKRTENSKTMFLS